MTDCYVLYRLQYITVGVLPDSYPTAYPTVTGWCATRFISDSIGARLLKLCSISSGLHAKRFLSMMDNPSDTEDSDTEAVCFRSSLSLCAGRERERLERKTTPPLSDTSATLTADSGRRARARSGDCLEQRGIKRASRGMAPQGTLRAACTYKPRTSRVTFCSSHSNANIAVHARAKFGALNPRNNEVGCRANRGLSLPHHTATKVNKDGRRAAALVSFGGFEPTATPGI
jgi:hypothetical protein